MTRLSLSTCLITRDLASAHAVSTLTLTVSWCLGGTMLISTLLLLLGATAGTCPAALQTTFAGIRPLHTQMSEVVARFGDVQQIKAVEGGDSGPVIMCYRSGRGSDRTYLLVESSAAGAYGREVTGFQITRNEPRNMRLVGDSQTLQAGACGQSRVPLGRLKVSNGLALGMSRARVEKLLGEKGRASTDSLHYLRTGPGCYEDATPH